MNWMSIGSFKLYCSGLLISENEDCSLMLGSHCKLRVLLEILSKGMEGIADRMGLWGSGRRKLNCLSFAPF